MPDLHQAGRIPGRTRFKPRPVATDPITPSPPGADPYGAQPGVGFHPGRGPTLARFKQTARGFRPSLFITGITRDLNGNPLAGCEVKLFRTDNDQMLQAVISDSVGKYSFTLTDNSTTYYAVASSSALYGSPAYGRAAVVYSSNAYVVGTTADSLVAV